MAHRTHHAVESSHSDVKTIYASAVGAAAAELTGHNDDLVSSVRSGAGTHALVFRHKYPKKKHYSITCVGATAGLVGRFTAWDPAAGTATLQLEVGATGTDAAATDTILIKMDVRNSNYND